MAVGVGGGWFSHTDALLEVFRFLDMFKCVRWERWCDAWSYYVCLNDKISKALWMRTQTVGICLAACSRLPALELDLMQP